MKTNIWTLVSLGSICSLIRAVPVDQVPLRHTSEPPHDKESKQLHGRFLHISDLHPDPYYKYHGSVSEEEACHRGKGPAGHFGAEGTSCDSPYSLINDTFQWIEENLKDSIDFVIWTGDSARHDNDEELPRDAQEIKELNEFCVGRFMDVFGKDGVLQTPVVPTFGNNDILPHNIFYPGPNSWTRLFLDIWRQFIPESQRHGFEYGGWFWSEVIPGKLAVLSINSLYFAENNAAVDGCAERSEPGYAQFDWLRIQLQYLRKRGMKAIIMGHQAPARTDSKTSWDESCWQKYTLWLYQYRDIIVGTAWGHMNIDHFIVQDIEDVTVDLLSAATVQNNTTMADSIGTKGLSDYLIDMREQWGKLPSGLKKLDNMKTEQKKDKVYKEIGGPYAQRYSLSLVTASVVPNYFPTFRVVEYNTSGLDSPSRYDGDLDNVLPDHLDPLILKKKFKIPKSPSKSTPPGPAYSPQTFTWLKYTQYYSNLTIYNNDFVSSGWDEGKFKDEEPPKNREPKKLEYEIEYDTAEEDVYDMKDLTVLSYLKLAEKIGKYKPLSNDEAQESKKKKKHKKKKEKKNQQKLASRVWHAFVRRAYVGAMDESELKDKFN